MRWWKNCARVYRERTAGTESSDAGGCPLRLEDAEYARPLKVRFIAIPSPKARCRELQDVLALVLVFDNIR